MSNEQENEIDFQLQFTQQALMDSQGKFQSIQKFTISRDNSNKKLLKYYSPQSKDTWVYFSGLYLKSVFGQAYFDLEFCHNGQVIVTKFVPSVNGDIYNPDVRCLIQFCLKNGWKAPQPVPKCNID